MMKTVELFQDYDYHPHKRKTVRFHAGITYTRVLEVAAYEIERNGAGRIISPDAPGTYLTRDIVDAGSAFRPRPRGRRGREHEEHSRRGDDST